jgi:uncharacterized protein YgbK (DUF1537 family)
VIGVVADDLTGAAEVGAVGLNHGLRTEILVPHLGAEFVPATGRKVSGATRASRAREAELICIDTDSRSCPAAEAGSRAAAAARLLRQAGARWIYKKVDSVLRGQVTAEVEAVMRELGVRRALLLPANPSLGRTIRRGRYYIRGELIHRTEFADDPEHPRNSADVLRLMGQSQSFLVSLCGVGQLLPGTGIIVGAAATSGDLKRWARRRTSRMLVAGGAEFFGALLVRAGLAPAAADPAVEAESAAGGPELFVCGTSTEAARRFVRSARAGGTPIFSLPKELVWGAGFTPVAAAAISQKVIAALRAHPRVVLCIGLREVHERSIARWLATHLAQIAGTVLRQTRIGHVYAEGGATAAELAQFMGWGRFTVARELAPGVATLAVADGSALRLTIKPGSYEWPESVREPARPTVSAPGAGSLNSALSFRDPPENRQSLPGSCS